MAETVKTVCIAAAVSGPRGVGAVEGRVRLVTVSGRWPERNLRHRMWGIGGQPNSDRTARTEENTPGKLVASLKIYAYRVAKLLVSFGDKVDALCSVLAS